MNDNIFETLKELGRKKESKVLRSNSADQHSKRKDPSYIFLDENNQVKEIPLSKLDSAGASINRTMRFLLISFHFLSVF
jgi:hypothetical protein